MIFLITSILLISASVGFGEDNVTLPSPHIIILGATGVGKSSLANVLIGEPVDCEDCTFPICDGADSCTKSTTYAAGQWIGIGENFTIVDTPGFGDSDNDDPELITSMISTLKNVIKTAKGFLLTFKGDDDRFDSKIQQMIREVEALFGREFWKHVLLEFTFWSFDAQSVAKRNHTGKNEEWKTENINKALQEKFSLDFNLSAVFIDSWAKQSWNLEDENQQIAFNREAGKAWDLITSFPTFEFKTIEDILADLTECKNEVDYLNDVIEGNITDINNAIEAMSEQVQENIEGINNVNSSVTSNSVSINDLANSVTSDLNDLANSVESNLYYINANIDDINDNAQCIDNLIANDETLNGRIDHFDERLNDNTFNIVENKLQIQTDRKQTDKNTNNIDANKNNITTNSDDIVTNLETIETLTNLHISQCGYKDPMSTTGKITDYRLVTDVNSLKPKGGLHIETGVFTAPIQGTYLVNIHFITVDAGQFYMYPYKNDKQLSDFVIRSYSIDNDYDNSGTSVTIDMTTNDTLHVETTKMTGDHIGYITFCVTFLK